LDIYFFDFLEKVVGPGLQGRHVATPVCLVFPRLSLRLTVYSYNAHEK